MLCFTYQLNFCKFDLDFVLVIFPLGDLFLTGFNENFLYPILIGADCI